MSPLMRHKSELRCTRTHTRTDGQYENITTPAPLVGGGVNIKREQQSRMSCRMFGWM